MECVNPSCKCRSIPKVREDQYEDWTERSAETKARFGQPRQTQESQRPRCWKCERPDAVPHEWHDDGTVNAPEGATSIPTREACDKCGKRGLSFFSPHHVWKKVAGDYYHNYRLCVPCYAELGDEKLVAWDEGLECLFVSLVTQQGRRG